MTVFLLYLVILFTAISGLTWWLMGVAIGEDFRAKARSMSDSQFAKAFIRFAIIATVATIGWVLLMSWPPPFDDLHFIFTSLPGSLALFQPLSICGFFLWLYLEESRRRSSRTTDR